MKINPNNINEIASRASVEEFARLLEVFLRADKVPEPSLFLAIIQGAINTLDREDVQIRPIDSNGEPGGFLDLSQFSRSIILPDLHARREFLLSLISWKPYDDRVVLQLLEGDSFTLLCLGDGVHSEAQFASRWKEAYKEYIAGYKKHTAIDGEITDSFQLMCAIMLLKIRYPQKVHFIKGNHENILNEMGGGNYSFAKFAYEGAMICEYFKKFYGEELLFNYCAFEKRLPIFAVGRNFVASHSEPAEYYTKEDIINYATNPELIEAFTWTDNHSATITNTDCYLNEYFPSGNAYYFGGHRPIKGLYNLINQNRYVQIHNPKRYICVKVDVDESPSIELDRDIVELRVDSDNENDTTVLV